VFVISILFPTYKFSHSLMNRSVITYYNVENSINRLSIKINVYFIYINTWMPRSWISILANSRRDILMRDYLANPSLYYDSTDKLFVVPEGRTKNCVVLQARLQRRKENGGRLGSGQTLQRKDTIVLFFPYSVSLSLSLFLSLFLFSASFLFFPSRVESELTARDNRVAAFLPRPRESRAHTDRITEKSSRREMPTRYSLRNPASADVRGICKFRAMFVSHRELSQFRKQLWSWYRSSFLS